MRHAVVFAALIALVLAGCGPEADSYDGVAALAAAVNDAGVECAEVADGPPADLVESSGTCEAGMQLFVFADEEDRDTWMKVGARLRPVAIGPNWAALGTADEVNRVADELGADVTAPVNR